MSRGLGASLDWLIFGTPASSENIALIVDRATDHMSRLFAETLLHYHREGRPDLIIDERILELPPEESLADLVSRAAEKATALLADGTTKADLLTWQAARTERLLELMKDRFGGLAKPVVSSAERGSGN